MLNGDPAVSGWVLSFAEVLLPAVVLGELRFGAARSGRPAENHARVDVLLAGCRLLPVPAATCDRHATVRLGLKQQGTPIPANDVWIAASRVEHGVPMATRDGHMNQVPGLTILTPP